MSTPPESADPRLPRVRRELRRVHDYLQDGNASAARACAETLTRQHPSLAIGWFWRSLAEAADGRVLQATRAAMFAARLDTNRVETHAHLARCHMLRGDVQLALSAARTAAALPIENPSLRRDVAAILSQCGAAEEAIRLFQQGASTTEPDASGAFGLGTTFARLGRLEEAEQHFELAITRDPLMGMAHWSLAQLRVWNRAENHVDRLRDARRHAPVRSEALSQIEFALAKELDDLGEHGAAADLIQSANAFVRLRLNFRSESEARLFASLEADVESLAAKAASLPGERVEDSPVPIFILGMPRAGGSLVERLLGNHADVRLGGELQEFNVCVKRALAIESGAYMNEEIAARLGDVDWTAVGNAYRTRLKSRFGAGGYVTDRLPGNFFYAHVIAAALPEARIVHVARDPMDNCFALWREPFGAVYPFTHDQQALAAHYARYAAWMRRLESSLPQRIFPIRYEQLVSVPGLISRQLYRHCGLDWEDGAEDPARNDKLVAAAMGPVVRAPIHTREVGAARPYLSALGELREALTVAGLVARD